MAPKSGTAALGELTADYHSRITASKSAGCGGYRMLPAEHHDLVRTFAKSLCH